MLATDPDGRRLALAEENTLPLWQLDPRQVLVAPALPADLVPELRENRRIALVRAGATWEHLEPLTTHEDVLVRGAVLYALRLVLRACPQVLQGPADAWVQSVADDPDLGRNALELWGWQPALSAEQRACLVGHVEADDPGVRGAALGTLLRHAPDASLLARVLAEPDPGAQEAIIGAMAAAGVPHPAAVLRWLGQQDEMTTTALFATGGITRLWRKGLSVAQRLDLVASGEAPGSVIASLTDELDDPRVEQALRAMLFAAPELYPDLAQAMAARGLLSRAEVEELIDASSDPIIAIVFALSLGEHGRAVALSRAANEEDPYTCGAWVSRLSNDDGGATILHGFAKEGSAVMRAELASSWFDAGPLARVHLAWLEDIVGGDERALARKAVKSLKKQRPAVALTWGGIDAGA